MTEKQQINLTLGKDCPFKRGGLFSLFKQPKCKRSCALYVQQPYNVIKTDKSGEIVIDPATGTPIVDEKIMEGCIFAIGNENVKDMTGSMTGISHLTTLMYSNINTETNPAPPERLKEKEEKPPHLQSASE